jgi:hypothetical protein
MKVDYNIISTAHWIRGVILDRDINAAYPLVFNFLLFIVGCVTSIVWFDMDMITCNLIHCSTMEGNNAEGLNSEVQAAPHVEPVPQEDPVTINHDNNHANNIITADNNSADSSAAPSPLPLLRSKRFARFGLPDVNPFKKDRQ